MDLQKINHGFPFTQETWKDHLRRHGRLLKLAYDLKNSLNTRDSNWIYVAAMHFSSEVEKHIREEEAPEAMFSQILSANPEVGSALEALHMQHIEILATLKAICSEADENLVATRLLADDCLGLVIKHETDEEELFRKVLEKPL